MYFSSVLQCFLMFDDLIAEVFAKGPKGGPGGSCMGLQKAHALISGDRGVLRGSWGDPGSRRASLGAADGQEAMYFNRFRDS